MYDVAFAMNHASAHKVTEVYVKPDYSIVSELNRKVIDFVFYDKLPDLLEDDVDVEQTQFRISFKNMVRGTVFFQEKKIYSFEDLGSVPGFVLCGTGCGFLCGEGESRS